ncbi:hypothetical protein Goshw_004766 [Gossypium schwendimanii]|uniref:Uncharacterized protein n=1 Tax=Gossypium schwendimanii TaxID=34291 RepID=A0A7J9N1U5_GOSSC|nr:hypothetical protein [Gossypium schwendimanii]
MLSEYLRSHDEGNWNVVQKKKGLARCGNSCRLRGANHWRPNLKKGSFSPKLHAKMGNKWALMTIQGKAERNGRKRALPQKF